MRSTTIGIRASGLRCGACLAGALLGAFLLGAPAVKAAGPAPLGAPSAPQWQATVAAEPTIFEPGQQHDSYRALIDNVGTGTAFSEEIVKEENSNGEVTGEKVVATNLPIAIRLELPEGVTVQMRKSETGEPEEAIEVGEFGEPASHCSRSGRIVTCTLESKLIRYEQSGKLVNTEELGSIPVGGVDTMRVSVKVGAVSGSVLKAAATVSGGGAEAATADSSTPVAEKGSPTPGVAPSSFFVHTSNDQAGAHPNATSGFVLTTVRHRETNGREFNQPLGSLNVAEVNTPPGLIGSAKAAPKCSFSQYRKIVGVENERIVNECPRGSLVGAAALWLELGRAGEEVGNEFQEREASSFAGFRNEVYNMTPPNGVAAEFAIQVLTLTVILKAHVRSGGDYGLSVATESVSQGAALYGTWVTFYGAPAKYNGSGETRPFIYNPTACPGPLTSSIATTFYQFPHALLPLGISPPNSWRGCGLVPFQPSIEAHPTTSAADSATGLGIDLKIPQNEEAEGLSSSDLKDATVTFPPGLAINPSSADGLQGCSEGQVGFTGFAELNPESEAGVKTAQFTPGPAECPDASKLGSVQMVTPLLAHPLPGAMYLATPHENPFDSLIAVYLTAYDPVTGVVIKLPGLVEANPSTGQLTATFDQDPQLPFEELKVSLFGDARRAALTTPEACGSYATSTSLVPWSAPEGKTATPSSAAFQVSEAPGGGACAPSEGQAPNAPAFEAGTESPIAGSYSPLVLHLKREDGSQHFSSLNVTLPPGLTGKIAGLQECPQPDIEAAQARGHEGEGALELAHPSCPGASEVGVVHVGTGSGAPDYVSGHAYFAGPYEGAPFSMVFITPAVAGPFDLGTVVVRAALYIDPNTAQVTVKSDPFPTILDGIPLDIRSISVEVNRPDFTLNPTSCNQMSVAAQEGSTAGQSATLSDRFQAGGCTTLPFRPSFSVSASASKNHKEGAALIVKLGAAAGQANLAKVHVELPKQLPSRLTTLQKACTDVVFDADPAACPAASRVGYATAQTPILPVPLSGPAYFVSHGGAAFPELIVVLSGDGVTVDLHGETFINKANITSSTFPSVPDVPVTSFELTLPEGPYSALDANGDLCAQKLSMPTTIGGQNGAQIQQRTPISIRGCKPQMRVLRHRVNGKWATVVVSVPSAGTLRATGGGVVPTTRRIVKAGTVTLRLRLTKREQRFVAHHRGRRLKVPIALAFSPGHGPQLSARVAVLMK